MSLEILQKCSRTFDCRYIWRHFCKIHFATNKTQNQHQVFSEKLFFVDLRAMFYFEHIQNEFVVYDMYNPSILPNTKLVKRRICHFFKQPIRVQCNFIHQSDHFFLQCLTDAVQIFLGFVRIDYLPNNCQITVHTFFSSVLASYSCLVRYL